MARSKKNNDDSARAMIWTAVKVLLILGVGYALGWNFGYIAGEDDGRSQARAAMSDDDSDQSSSEVSDTDAYGRSPGHPHYGHNHN